MTRIKAISALFAILLAALLGACGSTDEPTASAPIPTATEPADAAVAGGAYVTQITTDFTVGSNRFVYGLVDEATTELLAVDSPSVNFFYINPADGAYVSKGEVAPKTVTIERGYSHQHADGVVESHGAGDITVYVADVEFDSYGNWAAEISGTHNGEDFPILVSVVSVHREGDENHPLPVGAPAPLSVQITLDDVEDLFEIDTSSLPDPQMHDMTIADAVTSGLPTVIVFGTPGFCVSLVCGPVKEMVDSLSQQYEGQVNFVHVEPYDLEIARSGGGLVGMPVMEEWRLFTEPWIYMIDNEGLIASRFEGIVSPDELRAGVASLLVQ